MDEIIFLALGTNLGDRKSNLTRAIEMLQEKVSIVKVSSLYETTPWGVLDQPDFLNQVIEGKTSLIPEDLLKFVKEIETKMGRVKSVRYGPRLIDIDILLYGNKILHSQELEIPHSRMTERAFVLVPLAEIQPELLLPETNRPIGDLLKQVDLSGIHPFEEKIR